MSVSDIIKGLSLLHEKMCSTVSFVITVETKRGKDYVFIKIINSGKKNLIFRKPQFYMGGNGFSTSDDEMFGEQMIPTGLFLPNSTLEIKLSREEFEDIFNINFRKQNNTWFTCVIQVWIEDEGKKYKSRNEIYCSEVGDFFGYQKKQWFRSWKEKAKKIN